MCDVKTCWGKETHPPSVQEIVGRSGDIRGFGDCARRARSHASRGLNLSAAPVSSSVPQG